MPQNQIIGLIPARWASSRFPGKPLADILGKSLIRRTYENAKQCSKLDLIVVATDDKRIFDHVIDFGGRACMTSDSCPTGTDRIVEAVKKYFPDAEIILNIQGDEPCLSPAVINALIEKIQNNPQALMATPIAKITNSEDIFDPSVVKCVFDHYGKALYFSRAPIPYPQNAKTQDFYRHLGVYCFKREFLMRYQEIEATRLQKIEDLEQLKILESGYPIHVCMVQDESVGVNTPDDIKKIEQLLCSSANISL